jgi:hypothetical protein
LALEGTSRSVFGTSPARGGATRSRARRARARGREALDGTRRPTPSEDAKESDDTIFAGGEREEEWAKDMIATRVLAIRRRESPEFEK